MDAEAPYYSGETIVRVTEVNTELRRPPSYHGAPPTPSAVVTCRRLTRFMSKSGCESNSGQPPNPGTWHRTIVADMQHTANSINVFALNMVTRRARVSKQMRTATVAAAAGAASVGTVVVTGNACVSGVACKTCACVHWPRTVHRFIRSRLVRDPVAPARQVRSGDGELETVISHVTDRRTGATFAGLRRHRGGGRRTRSAQRPVSSSVVRVFFFFFFFVITIRPRKSARASTKTNGETPPPPPAPRGSPVRARDPVRRITDSG